MENSKNENIYEGIEVDIILKEDQKTGKLTRGVVKDILTKRAVHPRGIKVRLWGGLVGRVQKIYDREESDQGYQV